VVTTNRYQTILGMGSSLEATTCYNLSLLPPDQQKAALLKLLDAKSGIGMNLMRVCIGSSDFTGDPWYSYDDVDPGQSDFELKKFSIKKDREYILPILKLAKSLKPDLLFFASPWSPPNWMKTSATMIGGSLRPECQAVYAEYFARFIEAYAEEGIPLHAVTVQNEPGVDRAREKDPAWYYPSCRWNGAQERDFIRDHLGPTLRRHGLKTEIWSYDHNFNLIPAPDGSEPGIEYPTIVMKDPAAAAFVSGVAFHGYNGKASGMSVFKSRFPEVPIHFSEGSVFEIGGAVNLVDYFRNHAVSYNAWVTMLDDHGKPNNGPFPASRAILGLRTSDHAVIQQFEYFLYGHFMKFVQRGAQRIGSESKHKSLAHVAFKNPNGETVVVVVNPTRKPQEALIQWQGLSASSTLPGESLATFVWP
jgi:glucosylceramidase